MKAFSLVPACVLSCCAVMVCAQSNRRIPDPAAYLLSIAPDARASGMGFAGTATSGDANAMFWNPGKLPDAPHSFGASATYGPWLPNLVDDAWTGFASAYKKLPKGQALGASVLYYYQPRLSPTATFSPGRDLAVSAAYAKELGSRFSMGFTFKYISSSIGTGVIYGTSLETARTVAADIGAFYHSQATDAAAPKPVTWTWGVALANVGGKLDYGGNNAYFLPTTLRVGGGLSYTAHGKHKLNLTAEAGKLLVPTPSPGRNVNQKPYLEGIFESFSDAPGGFKEEMQEVNVSFGAEYWYRERFALRGGYRGENAEKGGRKFFTAGAGVRFLDHFGIDFAYLFPTGVNEAMKNMYRIGGSVYF